MDQDLHPISAMPDLAETPLQEPPTPELSLVAAQLLEAASRAREGDFDATRTLIARALALLGENPSVDPTEERVPADPKARVTRGGLPAWQVRRVIAHVDSNLSRRITVRELARVLDLNASHFCRAFKCAIGTSPRDYVLRRRVEAAQRLMLDTSEPLSSIAAKCGMCDQPHFTRSFRRVVGETPNSWRRTRRDMW